MIIVNQDKDIIVNFDNVESIEIGNINENQNKGVVYVRLKSDYFYKIGEYTTEERAKEVLAEIVDTYTKMRTTFKTYSGVEKQAVPVYEMPKE